MEDFSSNRCHRLKKHKKLVYLNGKGGRKRELGREGRKEEMKGEKERKGEVEERKG